MQNRWTILVAGAVAVGTAGLAAGCGDEEMMGPEFGDIEFAPSSPNIGSSSTVELTMRNVSTSDLSDILIGLDLGGVKDALNPQDLCGSIGVSFKPESVPDLAEGGEATLTVTIDKSNVDLDDCPPGEYFADVLAAISGGEILGSARIRFQWNGPPM